MTTPYPESTTLTNHFSIFHLALHHQVEHNTFKTFYQSLEQHHWQLHDYLQTGPNQPLSQRAFGPEAIFTPYAIESLFGKTWMDSVSNCSPADKPKALLKERLSRKGAHPYQENLLLTQRRDDNAWLNCPLQFSVEDRTFLFTIEWVDLWLFSDNTGILAFKTQLQPVQSAEQAALRVDDLNLFNRLLRYTGSPEYPSQTIQNTNTPTQTIPFWEDLVANHWLGFDSQNVLMLANPEEQAFARYSRYSKLLTAAQIPNIEAGEPEFLWNRPVMAPDFTAQANYQQLADGQGTAQLEAYQHLMVSGYASVRDMLLLELATTSSEGHSWSGERVWQYDTDYIKRLFAEQGIKIWRYWSGLALRDTCAFLSYDNSMPLFGRKQQIERLYYPLYVSVYHQRFRLDCLSQQVIDYELGDCVKARIMLENFHAFHNQYWFNEVTVDFQGIEIAAKMKKGLEVDTKYPVVENEIKDISGLIDRKMQAGRQLLIAFLILAFYPFQYFGIGQFFYRIVEQGSVWQIVGLNIAFWLAIIWLFWLVIPRHLGFLCRFFARLYHKTTE